MRDTSDMMEDALSEVRNRRYQSHRVPDLRDFPSVNDILVGGGGCPIFFITGSSDEFEESPLFLSINVRRDLWFLE